MPRYTVVAQDTCENGPPAEASAGSQAFAIPHQLWQAVALPLWLVYDACRINWLFATRLYARQQKHRRKRKIYVWVRPPPLKPSTDVVRMSW